MKEKLKTFLLLGLFCLSIFLSRHLWISDFKSFADLDESIEDIEIEGDIIRPYKALLNFSKKSHTVIYEGDDLWRSSKEYIAKALTYKGVNVSPVSFDEFDDYLKEKSLVFHFPDRLNTYLLGKSLNVKNTNYITEDVPKIEYIYLSISDKSQFIIIGYGDELYKVDDFSVDLEKIKESMAKIEKDNNYSNYYSVRDSMAIDSPLYISYNILEKYPYMYLEDSSDIDEYVELARENSKKFFAKDIDYIREVIEDSGSILHIYDQEVLKYGIDGSLEYFNPLQESIKERNLSISLKRASEFLNNNIENSTDLHLSDVKKITFKGNVGYRFIFRYNIEGLELLEIEGKNDHVYIDVYNNYVQSYRTHLDSTFKKEYVDGDIIAPFTILNEEYDMFKEDYLKYNEKQDLEDEDISKKVFEGFKDMSMYYISVDEEDSSVLKPIWLFVNKDLEYMFDLYTGELIYKRKIE